MPVSFRLYNTLTRTTEAFVPLVPGQIGLYVCGMTVYDEAHVGHARAMMVFDTFVRWLRSSGWKVVFVRNFTDVDDKIITRATERGEEPAVLAQQYVDAFHRDADALGLLRPTHEPRVTKSIPAIVAMITTLVERGHAYQADGSVWFAVDSCPTYGELSGQKPGELRSADVGGKRSPADFALWKGTKPGEPAWESPWGPGRPGWHIECSAMVKGILGDTIDIHGGGLDLVFPHHENEVAQSECANGEPGGKGARPFARYWMHNGLLTMASGQKMGKSLGNVVNIKDLLTHFPAESLRLYYLQNHYRSPLPWNEDALPTALAMLARLYDAREQAESLGGSDEPVDRLVRELGNEAKDVVDIAAAFNDRFDNALANDFNTAEALGIAFELARAMNRFAHLKPAKKRGAPIARLAIQAIERLSSLGLLEQSTQQFQDDVKQKRLTALGLTANEIEGRLAERRTARDTKDWARADAIRIELDGKGIVVMDRPDGVDWRVKLEVAAAG